MKTKRRYNERLLKFAQHLEKITNHPEFGMYKTESLVDVPDKRGVSFLITYHEWVFKELPSIFPEWYFSEKTGAPVYERYYEDEGTLASVIFFFDLKLAETCHLFDLEGLHDVNHFGGKQLDFNSVGPEIAKNIYALLQTKENFSN